MQVGWETPPSYQHHLTAPRITGSSELLQNRRGFGLHGLRLFPDDSLPSLDQSHTVSAINSRKIQMEVTLCVHFECCALKKK